MAVALAALLLIAGLGVDLGMYYIERVRIVAAVDAAALAAAAELPYEPAAHDRALQFLMENGYNFTDSGDTTVTINSEGDTYYSTSGPDPEDADTIISIDTETYRDYELAPEDRLDSAFRVRIEVTQQVPLIFMRLVGMNNLPAIASATAENINNLDIVIVFDRSGSMEFDTLCYGCWDDDPSTPYRGGIIYPLPWGGPPDGDPAHCGPLQPYSYGGERYFFIEAEEYSLVDQPPYNRLLYNYYSTYWILQRNGHGATARSGNGAYIMHMPFPDQSSGSAGYYGVSCRRTDIQHDGSCNTTAPLTHQAPRADYDFVIPNDASYNDTYYIWVRGQAGDWGGTSCIHWGIDQVYQDEECEFDRGTGYDGASWGDWEWRRLDGSFGWTQGTTHTLNIWAGGAGFAIDRIAITTNSYIGAGEDAPGVIDAWNDGRGAYEWADGRTQWACDPCDARFAGYPGGTGWGQPPLCDVGANPDRRFDYIYDDEQPIRSSIEAAKGFVAMLDPSYDQIGFVRYSSNVEIAQELQCVRRLGRELCTPDVLTNTVIASMDATYANGSTNIGGAIDSGITALSTQSGHYGRPGAAHVMILMTDGRPTARPSGACDDDPDIWPGDANADCAVYYADEARDNSIVIYTVTLGNSADFELMEEIADMTGGVHRNAERPEQLPEIFEELYERIFLRLVD